MQPSTMQTRTEATAGNTATFANGYKLVDLVQGSEGRSRGGGRREEGRCVREECMCGVVVVVGFSLNLVDPLPTGRRRRRDTDGYVPEKAHACRQDIARKCYFCFNNTACLSGENAGSRRRRQQQKKQRLRCVCVSLCTVWSSGRLEAW